MLCQIGKWFPYVARQRFLATDGHRLACYVEILPVSTADEHTIVFCPTLLYCKYMLSHGPVTCHAPHYKGRGTPDRRYRHCHWHASCAVSGITSSKPFTLTTPYPGYQVPNSFIRYMAQLNACMEKLFFLSWLKKIIQPTVRENMHDHGDACNDGLVYLILSTDQNYEGRPASGKKSSPTL